MDEQTKKYFYKINHRKITMIQRKFNKEGDILVQEIVFNDKRNWELYKSYEEDGSILIDYYNDGKIVRSTHVLDDELIEETLYFKEGEKKVIKQISYGVILFISEEEKTEKGSICLRKDEEGETFEKTENIWDIEKNGLTTLVTSGNGEFISKKIRFYAMDDPEKVIRLESYDEDGTLLSLGTLTLNGKQQIWEIKDIYNPSLNNKIIDVYNDFGALVSSEYINADETSMNYYYTYNEDNWLISELLVAKGHPQSKEIPISYKETYYFTYQK